MRFSTGLFDYFFGERVTVEVPNDDGKIIRRSVTRQWLEKMEAEGTIRELGEVVRVHHLAVDGYVVEPWIVGRDVSIEDVQRFRDAVTHEMYVMSLFKNGEIVTYFLTKDKWEIFKVQLEKQGLL